MCGIIGFYSPQFYAHLKSALSGAADTLCHRGPDDSGIYLNPEAGVGLAHRRLSIIDLSPAGHQPMCTENGDICITYNGEIYNFKEIRKTLAAHGHRFSSNSDTEVLLNAYRQWGLDALQRLQGMFAFGLWDNRQRRLILARDRIGIKPLYYYHDAGTLIFASELKGLMAFKQFSRDIDRDALAQFLHYQYVPAPKTIFCNTRKLLPGHFLILERGQIRTAPYWNFPEQIPDETPYQGSEADLIAELDAQLTQAVKERLVSDVPLGALLSGGIDSSVVVALMQKICPGQVKTFSIGFKEKGYNEAPWAERVARHLGTDHQTLYVTPKEARDIIPKLPEIYDEPFADSSAIPTYWVSRLTRSRVTVALSGDGGDEQFAGYVRYWSTRTIAAGIRRLPEPLKLGLAAFLHQIPHQWAECGYSAIRPLLPQRLRVTNFTDKWEKLIRLLRKAEIRELYRMTICLWSAEAVLELMGIRVPAGPYEAAFAATEGGPLLARLMRVDQKTYLPDAMLTKVDRASMTNALEVRVPFLDHRVVQFTAGIPDPFKYRNGTGKYILKKLLTRYLPQELIERPKMGFAIPIDHWLRTSLKGLLCDYLSPRRIKAEGLFDVKAVEQRLNAHLSLRANHHYRLWALLMWEMWRERWMA